MNEIIPITPPPRIGSLAIAVVGLGGAGCHALQQVAQADLDGVRFLAVHSNQRELEAVTITQEKILLGAKLTRGIGTGGDPDLGQIVAEKEAERLRSCFDKVDLVLVVGGLGGGTAGGAGPILAKAARDTGALVVGVVTLPFDFEGARRQLQGYEALLRWRAAADAVICLPNQKLLGLLGANASLTNTFQTSNELLAQAVRGLWQMLTLPGLMNVSLADLCSALRGRHVESRFATARAAGENRPQQLIDQLAAHPLLDQGEAFSAAESILVSLIGGPDLSIEEVQKLMEHFNSAADNARVVVGAATHESSAGVLSISVVVSRRNNPSQSRLLVAPPTDSAWPDDDGDTSLGQAFFRGVSLPKTSPRYVPPPPELSEDQKQNFLQSRARTRGTRPVKRWKQEQLPLQIISKGRFEKSEPTLHRGEDLDVPTYIRRGLGFN